MYTPFSLSVSISILLSPSVYPSPAESLLLPQRKYATFSDDDTFVNSHTDDFKDIWKHSPNDENRVISSYMVKAILLKLYSCDYAYDSVGK